MNIIKLTKKAHEIRRAFADKNSCRPSDMKWKEALLLAEKYFNEYEKISNIAKRIVARFYAANHKRVNIMTIPVRELNFRIWQLAIWLLKLLAQSRN